jgi:hypothetical protein
MTEVASSIESINSQMQEYASAVSALRSLPDHCAADVEEIARRIGTEKLALIGWSRADLKFARLVASKVRS